jgi:NAD(P)-dependent dehydrogenase (short-subunit alcohol dehydrogenase family)
MAVVVVTGSTKGIGRAFAEEFLRRGHNVAICSRNPEEVAKVTKQLDAISRGGVIGQVCDTTDKAQVQALWDATKKAFGRVDYWINNAGTAIGRHLVHELPEDSVRVLINSNMLGTTFGSQVAIAGFRKQGSGNLYNVLGGSFQGKQLTPGMGVYSSTKAAINRLTIYLESENKDMPEIIVGSISPGMLITENWFAEQKHLDPAEWEATKPILNVLCDHLETAIPWLTDEVLKNKKSGKRIAWLTTGKITKRFMQAYVLRQKRDMFSRYDL